MRGVHFLCVLLSLVALVWFAPVYEDGSAWAQEVEFETLLPAQECVILELVNGRIYGGLANGGILVWNVSDPSSYVRWTSSDGMTANQITDLDYSGRYLWAATSRGGLTRMDIAGSEPQFQQFTNIGGLKLSAVAGALRGEGELVFYGMLDSGVGRINDGLPGQVYTAEESGLVDNRVTDLIFFQDDLWVATQDGISKFSANLFTEQSAGLMNRSVNVFHTQGDTFLVAGTANGVYRWDSDNEEWTFLSGLGGPITSLTGDESQLFALRDGNTTSDRLWLWDGAAWSPEELPHARTRALFTDGDLWAAGRYQDSEMSLRSGQAFLARRNVSTWASWETSEQLPFAVDGVGFSPDGSLWLGSQTGDAVGRHDGSDWYNIYQLATVANDSMGLFANSDGEHGPNVLALDTRANGEIWFSQFRQGILRYAPAHNSTPESFEHITVDNSGLNRERVVELSVHSRGPIMFANDRTGVDLLADPDQWSRSDVWMALPTGTPGLGGTSVKDIAILQDDVIWFAVDQIGAVRWDPNGDGAGPGDDLTWLDPSDDRWDFPVTNISGSLFDFRGVLTVAGGQDGSVWAGGSGGAVNFRFEPGPNPTNATVTLVADYREKVDAFFDGLLTSTITDLQRDGNGDMWVACDAGLNRIRIRGNQTTIDTYTDLVNFFDFSFGILYSPSIIVGLPGGETNWELDGDGTGRHLLVGAGNGACLLTITPIQDTSGEALAALYLYPNPYLIGNSELKLGGVTADVFQDQGLPQGGASVEIYNLEGQLVFEDANVAADSGFWDGRNRFGNSVAPGLYAVKVNLSGQTAVKTLAVVR